MTGNNMSKTTKSECQRLIRQILMEKGELTAAQLYASHFDYCTKRSEMRSVHRLQAVARTARGVLRKRGRNGHLIYYME